MQTCCPKCSTIVKSSGGHWELINPACPDLVGTPWNGQPEFCPLLSEVVRPEVELPGVAQAAAVQAAIDLVKVSFLK